MSQDSVRVEKDAVETAREGNPVLAVLRTSVGRNAGLVVALLLICIVGTVTAGDRFASTDNVLTILRLAAIIGVVSIGMTFVIIGGGIDLSVGAIVALSSVWCTTLATQDMARDVHWVWMVAVALLVGSACGLVNGLLIAYGGIVPFIMTLAMLASARGLAEIISGKKTQIVSVPGFLVGSVSGAQSSALSLALPSAEAVAVGSTAVSASSSTGAHAATASRATAARAGAAERRPEQRPERKGTRMR